MALMTIDEDAYGRLYYDIDNVPWLSTDSLGRLFVDLDLAPSAMAYQDSQGRLFMATSPNFQPVPPDGVISSSGFTGTLSDVQANDATWLIGV